MWGESFSWKNTCILCKAWQITPLKSFRKLKLKRKLGNCSINHYLLHGNALHLLKSKVL